MLTALERSNELVSNAHLYRLLTPAGVAQFCRGMEPDPASGTCLDDNVRAWLVAAAALRDDPSDVGARAVGDVAADFVVAARRPDGRFRNMADCKRRFLEDFGSDAAFGRTMWACGVIARCSSVAAWRAVALDVLIASLPATGAIRSLNGRAYLALGLAAALASDGVVAGLEPCAPPLQPALARLVEHALYKTCRRLHEEFRAAAVPDWMWWKPRLTWGNARMPQAMLAGGVVLKDDRFLKTGWRALEFLDAVSTIDGVFVPIGNEGWYARGGVRAIYDQQPIEACCMVDAWMTAYRITGHPAHRHKASVARSWFDGNNTEGIAVAIPSTGACYDGLRRGAVNVNAGAESTLSYISAAYALRKDDIGGQHRHRAGRWRARG
ncbi:MAG TPA: hypothetical protein VEJ20_04285 [Candidatus Eremiobacteraceae bacterium]|nr:hypothetical protein [Candidatus Eremiobacteraceae bacterium]